MLWAHSVASYPVLGKTKEIPKESDMQDGE